MLTNFDYNGKLIQRRDNGLINLTQMCQANDKKLSDWFRLKGTKAYIEALSGETGIPASKLINVSHGNQTWGHASLAINLSRWISPRFAVWCDSHIFVLMETGETKLDEDPIDKMIRLEELKLQNKTLDNTMLTIHGRDTVLALRGFDDVIVESEINTIEVIDQTSSEKAEDWTRTKIVSAKEFKRLAKERKGQNIKSMASVIKRLRELGRDDLITVTNRKVMGQYVHPDHVDEVLDLLYQNQKQLLIGE